MGSGRKRGPIGMASRRKEEPKSMEDIPPSYNLGTSSFITRQTNKALKASKRRMLYLGKIKITLNKKYKGGDKSEKHRDT